MNTHSVLLLSILGGKSNSMVTFSVRLLVRQSSQLRAEEIISGERLIMIEINRVGLAMI